jgi:hypothetical protein
MRSTQHYRTAAIVPTCNITHKFRRRGAYIYGYPLVLMDVSRQAVIAAPGPAVNQFTWASIRTIATRPIFLRACAPTSGSAENVPRGKAPGHGSIAKDIEKWVATKRRAFEDEVDLGARNTKPTSNKQ